MQKAFILVALAFSILLWTAPRKTTRRSIPAAKKPAAESVEAATPPPTITKPYAKCDFKTASEMRDAVAHEMDMGSPRTQLKMKIFTNDSKVITDIFRNDQGTVQCQGASYYLHLKYLEAGYRSYLLGFRSEFFTHAMVLIEIENEHGERKMVVQDPTFNLTYVDASGKPLSLFEIIAFLADRKHDAIHVQESPRTVVFLQHPLDPDPTDKKKYQFATIEYVGPSRANPELAEYKAVLTTQSFASFFASELAAYCTKRGMGLSLLYPVFETPLYIHKGYPMNAEAKAEADRVFKELLDHHTKCHTRK